MVRDEAYDFSASNEELLEQCKRQDQDALRVLLRRHERPVYNLLYRMLSSHEDAEEALAEVFVKVWKGAAGFKGDSKFTTWLFRITSNTARDFLRSRKTKQEVAFEDSSVNEIDVQDRAGDTDPIRSAMAAEDTSLIMRAMQGLSEDDRLLVTLYHLQERDYDEIARIMDVPSNNLKVKLFRARQRLRKLCQEIEMGGENELRADTAEPTGLQPGTSECV